jgi:hypothetical protein
MPTKKTVDIEFHIGQGKNHWREAVVHIPEGTTSEQLALLSALVSKVNETFPIPVNELAWYGNDFVSAYMAAKGEEAPIQLPRMLTAMSKKANLDFGIVVLGFGKYPTNTVAEISARDPEYLDWLSKQSGVDAVRVTAAGNAYGMMHIAESNKNMKENE